MIEILIAKHCAPALAGIKPSNIVTCQKSLVADIEKEVQRLNEQLNVRDIYIEILCECAERALLMVYRKSVLFKHLNFTLNKGFLMQYGYKSARQIEEYFEILKQRLTCDNFPHEIGVFLGYPLRDIYCFINHRDEGCILIGDWKVYHNPEEAQKTFCRYRACKRAVTNKVSSGKSLAQIFCAV